MEKLPLSKRADEASKCYLLIIIVLLVAAWYTKPDQDAFKKFLATEKIDSPPMIEVMDGLVFTKYTVAYYDVMDVPTSTNSADKKSVAIPMKTTKYVGVFGKFWKLE